MDRAQESARKVAVCFVCLGNICRSPTAEGVFLALLKEHGLSESVRVDSAGTAAYHTGERADPRSRSFAKRRGYELPSVARQFEKQDFDRFDYVLAMDAENLAVLTRLAKGAPFSVHLSLLRDFDRTAPTGSSVPDPYYGGDQGFEEVLSQCERACLGLLEHIRSNHTLA